MDWRLFLSTFGLILIAELGDKTQIIVLAAAAGSRSPWSIFLGASVALVMAIGISVIVGFYLQKSLPLQSVQLLAGLLFFLFGALSIYKATHPSSELLASSAQYEIEGIHVESLGFLSRFTLNAALDFERAATSDYGKLAAEAYHPSVRELFLWLSQEDGKHHSYIASLHKKANFEKLPEGERLNDVLSVRPSTQTSSPKPEHDLILLKQSARHEATAMAFYSSLAMSLRRKTKLAGLFKRLAREEQSHLERISRVLADLGRKGA